MVDKLYSEVSKLVNDKVINMFKEEGPKVAFTNLYVLLPGAVRLFVKEEAFVKFCMDNKDKLFGKSQPARPAKKAAPKKKAPAKKTPAKKAVAAKKSAPKKAVSKR